MIDPSKVYYGGVTNRDDRFISPTILHNVGFDDNIMQDEIFGPILPVITFTNLDETIRMVKEPSQTAFVLYLYKKQKTGRPFGWRNFIWRRRYQRYHHAHFKS
jgi:aldehyde dehydrogenase (NAD+)